VNRDSRGTRLVLGLLLALALAVAVVDARAPAGSLPDRVRAVAGDLLGPAERAAAALVRPVTSVVDAVRDADGAQARIRDLERENDALRLQLNTSELARNRARELDALLGVAGLGRYRVVPARVVAIGPAQSFSWTVSIDAGTRDGVAPDMTVLNGDGLVGRVRSASTGTATVLLAADPTSSVGVRLESTMRVGVLEGTGPGPLELSLLNPDTPVEPGDRLVTFGSQGSTPFVAGVPVGEVAQVQSRPGALTKRATVTPYVDFTALELVGVVVEPPRKDPRDAVLPPRTRAAG
jgi:rod shape-determining protein MreC